MSYAQEAQSGDLRSLSLFYLPPQPISDPLIDLNLGPGNYPAAERIGLGKLPELHTPIDS